MCYLVRHFKVAVGSSGFMRATSGLTPNYSGCYIRVHHNWIENSSRSGSETVFDFNEFDFNVQHMIVVDHNVTVGSCHIMRYSTITNLHAINNTHLYSRGRLLNVSSTPAVTINIERVLFHVDDPLAAGRMTGIPVAFANQQAAVTIGYNNVITNSIEDGVHPDCAFVDLTEIVESDDQRDALYLIPKPGSALDPVINPATEGTLTPNVGVFFNMIYAGDDADWAGAHGRGVIVAAPLNVRYKASGGTLTVTWGVNPDNPPEMTRVGLYLRRYCSQFQDEPDYFGTMVDGVMVIDISLYDRSVGYYVAVRAAEGL